MFAMLEAFDELDVEEGRSSSSTVPEHKRRAGTDVRLMSFVPNPPIGNSCAHQVRMRGGRQFPLGEAVAARCDRFTATLGPMISRHPILDVKDLFAQMEAGAEK